MKIDIGGIIEGAYNSVIVKKWIKQAAKSRVQICEQCDLYSENMKKNGYKTDRFDIHCTDCGCNISLKTKCMSCACPKEKWTALVDEQQWESIKTKMQ